MMERWKRLHEKYKELKEKDDKDIKYIRNINFRSRLSPKEISYIKSLPEEKKIIIKRITDQIREDERIKMYPPKVVTGEELEKLKGKIRNSPEFEKMLQMIEQQQKEQQKERNKFVLPEIPTSDFSIDFNDFKKNELHTGGSSLISDQNMKILIKKLSFGDFKRLCKLDKNLKKWCLHNRSWVLQHYKKRDQL